MCRVFIDSYIENNPKINEETKNFLRKILDTEEVDWCRSGLIKEISGSVETGVVLHLRDGGSYYIYDFQLNEVFLEEHIKDNPLLCARLKNSVERIIL